ncbi:kinase [Rodentibacter caecimuris]|uniref:kinase n=1 Tax=Rodentibacter caecimuris TaxID=1796644 RepID=UPI00211A1AA6|nr:kinase [Rodentibacter heylii]MCQ9124344.1 kinase [Rodentibacter heylii]
MSFELRKQLADLKAESDALFKLRLEILQSKKENALFLMKNEAGTFLQSHGFNVVHSMTNALEADYKGSMKIKIKFSDPKDSFIGADITIDVDYLSQSFGFNVNLSRQSFDNIFADDLSVEIAQYQAMVDKLTELNCKDIDGSFEITLIRQNLDKLTFSSISDVLKFVLEM